MKLQKILRLSVIFLLLVGVCFCLNACGDDEESSVKKKDSTNKSTKNAIQTITDDYGKYYNITYDEFIDKLGEAITYATGYDSKDVVEIVTDTCKNLEPTKTSIDEYAQEVYHRPILFYKSEKYNIKMFYMDVYCSVESNKIVKVKIKKNNMKDYSYSDRETFITRFNCIANAVTKLLSGEQISDYGTDYKYKYDGSTYTHYFRYNESEIIFHQQPDIMGDQRSVEIMPANAENVSSNLNENKQGYSIPETEDEGPKWTPTQQELEAAFLNNMFTVEHTFNGTYTIQFSEVLKRWMTDYEIKYYNANDEDFSWYIDSSDLWQYEMEYDVNLDYTYVAVVSGNVTCSYYNPGEYEYDPEALCVLISFNQDGELTEVITVYASDLLLLNVLDLNGAI